MNEGTIGPSGALTLVVTRGGKELPPLRAVAPHYGTSFEEIIRYGMPQAGAGERVNRWRRSNIGNLFRGARRVMLARRLHLPHMFGALWLTHHSAEHGDLDLGLASLRVVTTAGVNFIVDAFQNTVEVENLKYHGIGTGTTAEAVGDTALVTELTTQYAADNTRPTGSLGEGATANVFRTAATITPDSGGVLAITEHGIFSQAATGGGTLLDRTKFAAVNLDTAGGDSISCTYDLTIAAGS